MLLTSSARASATPPSGPIDVSDNDDDFLAGCTGSVPSTVKLEPLDGESDSGDSVGSGGKKPELMPEEAGSVYVPEWSIKNGDSVKSHFALIGRILVNAARLLTSLPEGIDRLCTNAKKADRAEQKNCALKEQLANAQSHNLEEEKAKMDAERVALDAERSVVQAEKESLDFVIEEWKSRAEVLAGEKSDVYKKLLKRGRHMGLVFGYKNQSLKPISECNNYHPEAEQESIEAIQHMEQLTYPYIHELSKYFDRPLSELQALEAQGLKKEDAESMLKSLGSKRSRDEAGGSKSLASAADTPDKVVAASAEESVGTGMKSDATETEKVGEPSV
ncbi:hypothetical protein L1987_37349 [Smallanthus sonchifolius]|uniref:Uncharacterized protein n=1 Tax=Smallanthus sonchifolius TaxID=185202 RepID=A0ACB9HFY9_9ASTR|nr:hypothetical protein L1987_37349 [Smallanthus sonchifolius]